MNRSPNHNHWLDIALRGVKSNRDGIGARIKVVTKAGVQYNHQTSSVCYASSSLGPVHFGLGAEAKAQKVEITWPSGIVQTLEERGCRPNPEGHGACSHRASHASVMLDPALIHENAEAPNLPRLRLLCFSLKITS
jgi:hypothetical protein